MHKNKAAYLPFLLIAVLFALISPELCWSQSPPARPSNSVVDPSSSLSANLAGLFVMNEGSGTTDRNLVDGQLASVSGASAPGWNVSDPSLVFNGGASLSSYLNAGTDLVFDQLPINKMTLVAKVYVPSVASGGIAEKNDGNSIDSGFVFGWDGAGALQLMFEKSSTDMNVKTAANAVVAGQWVQVAFTWDGSVGTAAAAHLFVNGVEQPKVTSSDGGGTLGYSHATGSPFRIGNASFGPAGAFNGRMAYLAVYKGRILTASELNQLDAQLPITIDLMTTFGENSGPVTATSSIAGQGLQFLFAGWPSQQVTVLLSNNTMGPVSVNLVNADGSILAAASSTASIFDLPAATLPAAGTCDVVVRPTGGGTGSITVALSVQGGLRSAGSVIDPGNPLNTGLAGLFLMNEGSGSTDGNLVDGFSASFAGTSIPTWNSLEPSISFNGGASLNSYLNAGSGLTFDQLSTSKMTLVASVYANDITSSGVAEKNDGNTIDSGFVFGWGSAGALQLMVEKSGMDMSVITAASSVAARKWQQLAFTWDGTAGSAAAAHIFVNGVEQAKVSSIDGMGTIGYSHATGNPFRIGNASFGPAGSLNGKIAYLAVHKGRILTTAEMGQLDAQLPIVKTPSSLPAVAITSPANSSTVYLSSVPSLTAIASSTNGAAVTLVEFFEGTSKLGQLTAPPYTWPLSSFAVGSHMFMARVTDSYFLTAVSSTITVTFANPQVTAVTPSYGKAGQQVTITGTGFGTGGPGSVVGFNGVPAPVTNWGDSEVNVVVPSGSGSGPMDMTFPGGNHANGLPQFGPCPANQSCVSSFVFSPTVIVADGSQSSTGVVTVAVPPSSGGTGGTAAAVSSSVSYQCVAPAVFGVTGFSSGCLSPATSFSILVGPLVSSGSQTHKALAFVDCGPGGGCLDPGVSASLTVIGNGLAYGSPDNGPCTDCSEVGKPINVKTGNTYIQQTDYVLPGLGRGMAVARTWNSQWSTTGPLVAAGMFGDSWRATYEDRLQTTTSGVNYWLDDGKVWRFTLSAGAYSLTSPVDARGTLQFDSVQQQYTLTLVSGTKKIFGANGYLSQLVDRNGNAANLAYDTSSRLTQVTDAAGRILTFLYGDSSHPSQVTGIQDSAGIFAIYTYDAGAHLTRVTYGDNSQINYVYDSHGLITSVTDAQGKVLEAHTYDGQRRGLSSQRANGVELVNVSYPFAGQSRTIDSVGNGTNYAYAQIGEKTFIGLVSGPGCSSCGLRGFNQYVYDSQGNPTAVFDSNGVPTLYTYDSNGLVTSRSTPLNNHLVTWQASYNSFGELLTATDPLGNVTSNTYDTNGNLLTATAPAPDGSTAASVTRFAYDAKGQLTSVTDPLNHVSTLAYYPSGLLHTVTDAQNNVTSYEYDARGNRTAVVDALGNRTTFDYDAMNRLTVVHNPDTSTASLGYDTRGRRTSVTDGNGKVTSYAYDDADRLISVTDAANHVTQYAYDAENNLTSIADANLHVTSFTYDTQQHVTKTTFPSLKVETYTYDNVGNLMTKIDRKGQVISYGYDTLNRMESKTYPDSTAVNYFYDDAGRLTQVQDPAGTYGFVFDNMGRLKRTTTVYSFLAGQTFTNTYAYDAASNRTSFTSPHGGTDTYAYDTLNQLAGITDSAAGQFTFNYDGLGRRTALNRPNGVNTAYNYNSLSRLLSVLHQAGAATLDGASYTYDNAGNRTAKTNYLNNTTEQYTYDAIYQLTQVVAGETTTENYSYDAVGNRLSSLGSSPYVYNASNQLTSTSAATYTYDDNGNTLTKTDSTGTTQYNWDFENRLTAVVLPGPGGTVTFRYDPFGRRVQKIAPAGTTNYLYDGSNSVEEIDQSGGVLARYAQGVGVDEPLAALHGGAVGFYEQDGLGSVTSLRGSAGGLANTYAYDSYGVLTASTGTMGNPFQYTGREADTETSLRYYRARYYDSATGRFLSEDPSGLTSGINFYRYVSGNPVRYNDPFGLSQRDVQSILGLAQQLTNQMTKNGERIDPGPLNNLLASLQWLNPFSKKTPYKGCGEQADRVASDLQVRSYDDRWTFDVIVVNRGFHQIGLARSSNPNDPDIIFDPWNNEFLTVPHGWSPGTLLNGLGLKGN